MAQQRRKLRVMITVMIVVMITLMIVAICRAIGHDIKRMRAANRSHRSASALFPEGRSHQVLIGCDPGRSTIQAPSMIASKRRTAHDHAKEPEFRTRVFSEHDCAARHEGRFREHLIDRGSEAGRSAGWAAERTHRQHHSHDARPAACAAKASQAPRHRDEQGAQAGRRASGLDRRARTPRSASSGTWR